MWQYDYPDLTEYLPHATEATDVTVFYDQHFFLEMQDNQSVAFTHWYSQHFQGYMALTPEGVELAEHFFRRLEQVIDDPDANLNGVFDPENLAWISVPGANSAGDATWQRMEDHPLFTAIYKFRFLVTASSRHTGERRETWAFRQVNAARERTVQEYTDVLRESQRAFIRPSVTEIYHNPILTPEERELLENFNWESPNYE
jgi:hypothetical protein